MLPMDGQLPAGPGWAYEFKWDGVRIISSVRNGRLRMLTKRGHEVSSQFPELSEITETADDVILDGELVVFTGQSPDFGATVSRLRARRARVAALAETRPATMIVFDILRRGTDLRTQSYEQRRTELDRLGLATERWVTFRWFSDGPATVAASLEHGLEGVVSKRLASPYRSGRRSRDWIKVRHKGVSDAFVIGWVRRSSGGISILLAEATSTGLALRGRCTAPLGLLEALAPLAADAPPIAVHDPPRGVQWVQPELQVEITAASRAPDGRLRQPKFVRARMDQLG